eukprot:g3522.t1
MSKLAVPYTTRFVKACRRKIASLDLAAARTPLLRGKLWKASAKQLQNNMTSLEAIETLKLKLASCYAEWKLLLNALKEQRHESEHLSSQLSLHDYFGESEKLDDVNFKQLSLEERNENLSTRRKKYLSGKKQEARNAREETIQFNSDKWLQMPIQRLKFLQTKFLAAAYEQSRNKTNERKEFKKKKKKISPTKKEINNNTREGILWKT